MCSRYSVAIRPILAGVLGLALATGAFARPEGEVIRVALTFDDLPWVGPDPVDGSPADAVGRMVAVLNAHDAPATGFVVCDKARENPHPVEAWVAWGHPIGNHSSSHRDLDATDTEEWIEDVERCHEQLKKSAGYDGLFRFPMLHQGDNEPKRAAVAQALAALGMRNAHVTVDTSDWILTQYHAEAVARDDARLRRAVGELFLDHVEAAVRHADAVARKKLGRPIPQTLLLHANSLVDDYLDELLVTLRTHGVEFVSLDEALADPAYAREDQYVGEKGLSWLYRMKPASPGDAAWDDSEARRIRTTLDAELANGAKAHTPTHVSALLAGDAEDPSLEAQLEEAGSSERLRSLVVSIRGETVLEAYFNGVDETTPANLKSVTKSLTALLVGIALDEGWIQGVHDPVSRYLGRQGKHLSGRPLTVESLLTMSSGLTPVPYDVIQQREDWVESVLAAGSTDEAIGTFRYDTPVLQLLTAALQTSSGLPGREIANRYLFAGTPEKIPYWRTDPAGIAFGGNDAYLTPRGMEYLGNLVLNAGKAGGQRILDADFVRRATSVRIEPPSKTVNHDTLPVRGYGYLWWLTEIGGEPAAAALGHGGQMIYVVPSKDSVVVVTSRWPMASSTDHYQHVTRMLNEVFLPRFWSSGPGGTASQ